MKFNISTFLLPVLLLVSEIASAQNFLSENFNGNTIPSGWALDDQGVGACRWMVHAPSTEVPMLGSNYLFVNSDSAGSATVGNETITSPLIPLNAGSQVFLSFQHFFRKRNNRQDTGRVEVFFNGSWIKALEFAANKGTAGSPASELLNVSAWAGPEFRVRFQYKSLRAWYWAIDNIKVFTPPAADLGVAGIQNLSSPCGLAVPFPITVRIKNFGSQVQSGFPVSYQVAAQAAVTETFSNSILPGDSSSYTFSTPFSTSLSGNLNVISWTSLAGDTNSINDSTTAQAFLAPGSFSLVDFSGFTGANLAQIHPGWEEATGLNATTGNSAWTSADATQTPSLGSETIKVNLYSDFRREWVITPAFKTGADVNLKFKLALTDYISPGPDAMGSDDSLIVKISTNCGLSWQNLRVYTEDDALTNQFVNQTVSLAAYAGQVVKIAFYATDGSVDNTEDYDIHLDDIQLGVLSPNDMEMAELIIPGGNCGVPTTFPVKVRVVNSGSLSISSLPLSYQVQGQAIVSQNFSISLAPAADTILEFSTPVALSTQGNFFISAWGNLPGDANPGDDSTTIQTFIPPGSFSSVDFSGFTGSNLAQIHQGWTEASGLNATSGNSTWTSADVTQIQSLGSETIKVNLYTTFRREWVITPAFKPGNDVNLKFKLALTDYLSPAAATMGSDDSLIVKISTNCGLSWQNLRVYTAADALTNQFVNQAVSIAGYAGQVVKIAFYATDGNVDNTEDYDIHLDDVQLGVLSPNDMEMAELIIPGGNCGVSASFPVKVRVVNSGSLSISSLPLSYQVQGQAIVSQNFSVSLAPAADTILEFSTPVALSTQGNFFISAWGNLLGDANSIDDSVIAVPFSRTGESFALQNFTGFNGSNLANGWAEASGFNASTAGANWNPSASVQTTGLGSETAKINLYTTFKQDWIISPAISLSSGKALRFKLALTNWNGMEIDSMGSDDSLAVRISTDCGQSWQMLKLYTSADNLSNQLITQTIPLTAYIGQTIRIGFYASEGNVDDASDYDMHIDDIELISLNPADVGVTSLILPSLDCGLPPSLPVKVNIANLGTQPQTGFGISYSINAGTPVSETFSGTLAVGQVQVFQFAAPADFSAAGSYVIKAWTSLLGDQDNSNDSSTSAVLSTTPELLTGINFTGFNGTNLSTVFPGWSEKSGQIPTGSVSTWQASNASQTTTLGSATARVGLSGNSKREWILSPGFKPAVQSEVRFRLAVTDRNFSVSDFMGSDDSIVVKITTDCGQNWTFLRAFTAQNNLSNVLTNFTADLSAFAGQTCQLAFFATDGNIDNLEDFEIHLDDLQTGPLTTEVQNQISRAAAISLVPNPATGQVSIRGLVENTTHPRFFSASGKEFFPARITGSGLNFDISNLQAGYYLVRCGNSVAPLLVH